MKKQYRILFQGDSVTDCDRVGSSHHFMDTHMGYGYPYFASAYCNATYTGVAFEFINRGISGNRVRDLKARWQEDCIDLKPDVVSILIGINDTWRRFDSNDPTSTEAYEADYRVILNQIKNNLPETKIILMDPFVLPEPGDRLAWREDLNPRLEVCRRLAEEFGAVHVPLDKILNDACKEKPPKFWSPDGVHPSPEGHILITKAYVEALKQCLDLEENDI